MSRETHARLLGPMGDYDMSLAQLKRWSPRWMVALWIGGVVLQVALIGGPLWWALSHAAQWRAEIQFVHERWDIAERADSLSVAAQRATGATRKGSSADGPVGIVRVPSMRPSATASRDATHSMFARVLSALWLYAIPVTLVLITAVWWRRRPVRPTTV